MTDALDRLLSPDLLIRIRERAPGYDRRNAFCAEDVRELAASGYLAALVPAEFGGAGLSLLDAVAGQVRLAKAAPATALAVGMHLIMTGVARTMTAQGHAGLEFVLREAADGELFAFAISEPDNDLVLADSRTDAAPRPDGAYVFTGTKVFTSLSPVWTRLATFGLDSSAVGGPELVHAVLTRGTTGITIDDDWDTVGMRATQSRTTHLDHALAEPERVYRRIPAHAPADPLLLAILANFEILISAVYAGIGDRALELAAEAATARVSRRTGLSRAADPEVRRRIADAAMAMDALHPQLDRLAADVDSGADHGDQWARKLVGLKTRATATARNVVGDAMAITGGAGYRNSSEIARLSRDVLAGGFHPSDEGSARATVAAAVLGPLPE